MCRSHLPATRPEPLNYCATSLYDVRLNALPSYALFFPIACVFACASAFLEVYVVSARAHFAVFAVGTYVVFSSYFVADYFLARQSTSYARIPDDKKFYVLSNLIKSAVLTAYTPQAAYLLYQAIHLDEWSTPRIRSLGVLYAIPDFVSLFLVQRMALTTKAHHICVVIFIVSNLYNDNAHETGCRAHGVYAVFSTFAYLVNLLLASRFLPVKPRMSLAMSAVALVVHVVPGDQLDVAGRLIASLHARKWADGDAHAVGAIYAYLAAISMVVYDDVVLTKWLLPANCKKKWQTRGRRRQGGVGRMPIRVCARRAPRAVVSCGLSLVRLENHIALAHACPVFRRSLSRAAARCRGGPGRADAVDARAAARAEARAEGGVRRPRRAERDARRERSRRARRAKAPGPEAGGSPTRRSSPKRPRS